jgi:hypothetical protein
MRPLLTAMYTTVVYEYPAEVRKLLSIDKLPGVLALGLLALVAFPPLVRAEYSGLALLLHKKGTPERWGVQG